MLEVLFGAEMPLAVRFFLAFLIVLGLIGATAWAVRRFGAVGLGGAAPAAASRGSPSSTTQASTRAGASFSSAATISNIWC